MLSAERGQLIFEFLEICSHEFGVPFEHFSPVLDFPLCSLEMGLAVLQTRGNEVILRK